MSLPLPLRESFTQEGTGASTAIYTVPSTGLWRAYLSSTFIPGTTLTGTITQAGSGTTSGSISPATTAQSHIELNLLLSCVVGDTVTFTISENGATNTVKSLFNMIQVGASI